MAEHPTAATLRIWDKAYQTSLIEPVTRAEFRSRHEALTQMSQAVRTLRQATYNDDESLKVVPWTTYVVDGVGYTYCEFIFWSWVHKSEKINPAATRHEVDTEYTIRWGWAKWAKRFQRSTPIKRL